MKQSIPASLVLSAVVVSAGVTIWLSYQYWDVLKGADSAGATIRNIGLVSGSLIAIGLALWRSNTAQRQVEVAEQDSPDGQFQKAAGMLGHEDVFVRLGGVITLYYLGRNHLNRYGYQVCAILKEFSSLKRTATYDSNHRVHIQRVRLGGKGTLEYKGPPDGGEAFNAFWGIQAELSQRNGARNRVHRMLSRLFQRARSYLGGLCSRTDRRH